MNNSWTLFIDSDSLWSEWAQNQLWIQNIFLIEFLKKVGTTSSLDMLNCVPKYSPWSIKISGGEQLYYSISIVSADY